MRKPTPWSTPSRRGWKRRSRPISASQSKTRTGIPFRAPTGDLQKRDLKPLHDFRAGQRVLIREVQDDNPDRLRHWQTMGLIPGVVVLFVSYQPLDDMFGLEVSGRTIHVGSEGA